MNLSRNTSESRYAPHTYSIQQHLDKYGDWITGMVGAIEDRVIFESADVPHSSFFLPYVTGGVKKMSKLSVVESVRIPPGHSPRMKLVSSVKPTVDNINVSWDVEWRDTPVAIKFHDCEYPVIYAQVDFVVGTSSYEMFKTLIIVNRSEIQKVLANIAVVFKRTNKVMEVIRGSSVALPEDGYQWDRIVMHPDTHLMVKEDFEVFLKSQEWFKINDLPYRRGYLFYGQPGNGKTSAIRVMASHPLVSAFTIDMGNPDVSNADITELFNRATNRNPSVIVLEDIDRMFSRGAQEEERRKVTLQHLLNCLDGVTSPEGTIVIATANDPVHLDPALLKRPGRFDRVVEFKSPEEIERTEYFGRRSNITLTPDEVAAVVAATDGFTFAQLRESYIMGGQSAFAASNFDPHVKITFDRLMQGVENIKKSMASVSKYQFKKTAGFKDKGK